MFNFNHLFAEALLNTIKESGKSNLYEWKSKIETFDFDGIFNGKFSKAKKTATIDGVYAYIIEVPGFNKEMLDINLEKGILTVKGKNETKTLEHSFTLGEDTINKVTLDLGILTIRINEVAPKVKSTKVNID